jgi:hypothetical protein
MQKTDADAVNLTAESFPGGKMATIVDVAKLAGVAGSIAVGFIADDRSATTKCAASATEALPSTPFDTERVGRAGCGAPK